MRPALCLCCKTLEECFCNSASAREASTTFELGNGDALVTYELAAPNETSASRLRSYIPKATIFSDILPWLSTAMWRLTNAASSAFVQYFGAMRSRKRL